MDISSISSGWGSSACPTCGAEGRSSQKTGNGSPSTAAGEELTKEEKQEVTELKKRDKEVRAHEAAHVAAGGRYVRGGATYEFETGPDGRRYAVGGEVPIDTSPVAGDPRATIRKMQVVRAAALAPAQPSGADRAIAAKASAEAGKAQAKLMKEQAASAPGASAPDFDGSIIKNNGLEPGLPDPIITAEKKNPYYSGSTPSVATINIDIMA